MKGAGVSIKKILIFSLFLMTGLLAGAVLTRIAESVGFLQWLCWSDSIGIGWPDPVTIDLSIIRINFGIGMEMNVAKLLCIILSMSAYLGWGRKL